MALHVKKARELTAKEGGGIVSDRRLFVTRGQRARVVDEGDADAAILLAAAGHTIPAEKVAALGLEIVDGKVKQSAKHAAVGASGSALMNYDQETGPALKKAAEEEREKELAEGSMQTKVAVLKEPPGKAEADEAIEANAEEEETARAATPAKPAAKKAARKSAKKGAGK